MPNIPHGPTTTGDAVTTEIHQKTMESLNDRNRAALFGEFILDQIIKILTWSNVFLKLEQKFVYVRCCRYCIKVCNKIDCQIETNTVHISQLK